ncbi:MAG: asparagine synthase (glutamine-hydrolyzing) [Smithella sp.]
MCGISGFISSQPQPASLVWLMSDLIRHRGPDDEGFVLFMDFASEPVIAGGPDTPEQSWQAKVAYAPAKRREQVSDELVQLAFGHRRLSIIDLSPLGHQPMSYQAGRFWITYNGEIYNYAELRCELESFGHTFLSLSDTEVILAAYAQWGADCLSRFNGMWAFAIYDSQREEIFLARDRFGVKPLYYWIAPNGAFCFASEIKQFTVFPGWVARVNHQRAYDFLVRSLTDHTDETLFAGVYQLQPGYAMRLRLGEWHPDSTGRLPVEKLYELKPDFFSGSFTEAALEFRKRLKDAVYLRLRADVPVGSCLSGGLDSSAIVCLMNRLLHEKGAKDLQRTFSACSDVKRFDERYWIDQVVRMTGVDANYVYPSMQNLFKESSAITWHQDEPFGSTSIYAQWNVFRLAAQNGVKVMLDGQGSDEQLAGYHGYFGARFADLFRKGRLLRLWQEMQDTRSIHGYSEIQSMSELVRMMLPQSMKGCLKKILRKETPAWLTLNIPETETGYHTETSADSGKSLQSLS